MTVLRSFFGRQPDAVLLLPFIQEAAVEADRMYRNFIAIHSAELGPVELSERGLYKARLHAAVIVACAFPLKWPNSEDEFLELLNVVSALGLEPLGDPPRAPELSREDARSVAWDYMKNVLVAALGELRAGPSLPAQQSEGFMALIALYREALDESFGSRFSSAAWERFGHLVSTGVFSTMRQAVDVAASI
jgi:hypothetical protein